jgi:hypothetical protein
MTQPPFADGPPVPLLTEGTIDAATLRQLGADLEACAQVLSVRAKAGPVALAAPDELPLDRALEDLLTGTTRAVQVRYWYDGHEWTDTVVALGKGFRVVRCRHESSADH